MLLARQMAIAVIIHGNAGIGIGQRRQMAGIDVAGARLVIGGGRHVLLGRAEAGGFADDAGAGLHCRYQEALLEQLLTDRCANFIRDDPRKQIFFDCNYFPALASFNPGFE